MNCACFNCTERQLGCHDTCPKYKEFRKNKDFERAERLKKMKEDNWAYPEKLKLRGRK